MGGQKRGLDTSPWSSVSTKRKNTSLKCSLFHPQVSPELALKREGTAERQYEEPNYTEEKFFQALRPGNTKSSLIELHSAKEIEKISPPHTFKS